MVTLTTTTKTAILSPSGWMLNTIENEIDCTLDNSGIYTVINYTPKGIRLDIMSSEDLPIQSFICSNANALRKSVIKYITDSGYQISPEHASYIGYELARCSAMRTEYIQD
jgi:hypothetical protein